MSIFYYFCTIFMRESIDFMEKEKEIRQNPFFLDYDTPHATVPFDRIRFEDYEEAFMEGIRRDKEEIEKTVNDPEEPTFENTIARVDTSKGPHYYDLLDRVSKVFGLREQLLKLMVDSDGVMIIK